MNGNEGKRPSIQWECKAHVDVNKKDVFLTIRESQTLMKEEVITRWLRKLVFHESTERRVCEIPGNKLH